jgi:hypothetical protein
MTGIIAVTVHLDVAYICHELIVKENISILIQLA